MADRSAGSIGCLRAGPLWVALLGVLSAAPAVAQDAGGAETGDASSSGDTSTASPEGDVAPDGNRSSADATTDPGADGEHQANPEPAAPQESRAVTLVEVMELARAVSPLIGIRDAEAAAAAAQRLEARFLRFPRLRVNASLSPAPRVELEEDPDTGDLDPFSNRESDAALLASILGGSGVSVRTALEVVLPLTTFGKVRLARELADVGVDVADIRRDAAVAESEFAALRAYLGVQWYEEVDDLLREAGRRLDDAEEQLEIMLDDGDRSARTSLRQLTIARTDFASLRAEADQLGLTARHVLAATLSLPLDFVVEPLNEDVDADQHPSLEEILAVARQHRRDYQLLDAGVRAAQLQSLVRWRALTPDVYLGAQVGGAWTPTVDDVSGPFIQDAWNRFGFGFLVGLRWNMNPAQLAARARRADATVALAEAQRDAAWLAISYDVTEAWYEAVGKRDVLDSYDDALRAARAWLNQVQFQWDQGLADYEDFKDPLETYYRTAGGYYEALLRYRLALANLALKTGAPDLLAWPAE